MRLLHTRELRFEEFFDDRIPDYAILSHRWGHEEVSYQDFLEERRMNSSGYAKITAFCEYVATSNTNGFERNYEWVWIDTCCIDKRSSAELTEAINSMFKWYQGAGICVTHLSDVRTNENRDEFMVEFKKSQWFQRGWTLQELLAPKRLVFVDQTWTRVGSRRDFIAGISEATNIPERYVDDYHSELRKISVAEKMSWIAQRRTSRVEDKAYCLLGLFGINMPLIYGEGERAFRKLQEEIIRSSNDESVFLWDCDQHHRTGILTEHPSAYMTRHDHDPDDFSKIPGLSRAPYTITNQGLEVYLPNELAEKEEILLPLNCRYKTGAYAISLVRDGEEGIWRRSFWRSEPDPWLSEPVSFLGDGRLGGLYVVPVDWVWSRNDLTRRESDIIYIKVEF